MAAAAAAAAGASKRALCVICQGPMAHPRGKRALRCGHVFHGACVDQLVAAEVIQGKQVRCPVCRAWMDEDGLESPGYAPHHSHLPAIAQMAVRTQPGRAVVGRRRIHESSETDEDDNDDIELPPSGLASGPAERSAAETVETSLACMISVVRIVLRALELLSTQEERER